MGAVKRVGMGSLAPAVRRPVIACQSMAWGQRRRRSSFHHTSPSSVSATLVKIMLPVTEAMALGLDFSFVPAPRQRDRLPG